MMPSIDVSYVSEEVWKVCQ